MRVIPALLALVGLGLFLTPPARHLVAGQRYRATFDAPPAALGFLAQIQGLFPPGAAVTINRQNQIVAVFTAVRTGELDDPSTPELGDIQTPVGALKLRRLERLT